MGRRNSPRRRKPTSAAPLGEERPFGSGSLGSHRVEEWAGADWAVRQVSGAAATKPYRCPGCDHEVRVGSPHVVVWPLDAGAGDRRHWHTVCWSARERRGPTRRRP